MRVLPKAGRRLREDRIPTVQVVHAGVGKRRASKKEIFVAIPLLPVHAATPGEDGDKVADLDQLKPEAMLAAPMNWCPNPDSTVSLRVKGNSMSPCISGTSKPNKITRSKVETAPAIGTPEFSCNANDKLFARNIVETPCLAAAQSDRGRRDSGAVAFQSEWSSTGVLATGH
jgi:hypothetical protein